MDDSVLFSAESEIFLQFHPISPVISSFFARAPGPGQAGGLAAEVLRHAGLLPQSPAAAGGAHRGGAEPGGIQQRRAGGAEEERCLGGKCGKHTGNIWGKCGRMWDMTCSLR